MQRRLANIDRVKALAEPTVIVFAGCLEAFDLYLEKLVTARQARPMILVAAKSNTLGTRDAGCADLTECARHPCCPLPFASEPSH